MATNRAKPIRAYIGLGSNLDNPVKQVRKALKKLSKLSATTLITQSSLYRSAPMEGGDSPAEQPDFINAVVLIETYLPALALLDNLQEIEDRHSRDRDGAKWGPRTLDLDLLIYGDKKINKKRLTVPHPGLRQREFVLYPLSEIAGDLLVPADPEPIPLSSLIKDCPRRGLEKLEGKGG